MSDLKKLIKVRLTNARLKRDKVKLSFYQTFLGEIEKVEKDSKKDITDSQVNKQAKKWKNNLIITLNVAVEKNRESTVKLVDSEMELLTDFLPVYSLTLDNLLRVIQSIENNLEEPNIGKIMQTLAKNHKGLYDPEEAKGFIQELL